MSSYGKAIAQRATRKPMDVMTASDSRRPPRSAAPAREKVRKSTAVSTESASQSTSASGTTVRQIPSASIHVGLNPREHFDPEQIAELAASIKANGLLQPISVRPHAGGYQIIAGERQFRAMQKLEMKNVPAIVHNVDDATARHLALIENINRVDMRPGETARAYKALLDQGASVKTLAAQIGKSEAHVKQHLDLLSLPPHLQKLVDQEHLHMSVVRPLAALSPKGQEEAASRIMEHGLGVRSSKALIQSIAARESQASMFTSTARASKVETAAHEKYQQAIAKITEHLSHLDDETMEHFARAVASPFAESERLGLMAKQLRRMQNALEVAGHGREQAG